MYYITNEVQEPEKRTPAQPSKAAQPARLPGRKRKPSGQTYQVNPEAEGRGHGKMRHVFPVSLSAPQKHQKKHKNKTTQCEILGKIY